MTSPVIALRPSSSLQGALDILLVLFPAVVLATPIVVIALSVEWAVVVLAPDSCASSKNNGWLSNICFESNNVLGLDTLHRPKASTAAESATSILVGSNLRPDSLSGPPIYIFTNLATFVGEDETCFK